MLASVGIAGAAWPISVRLALVDQWQIISPSGNGDGIWRRKLCCSAGLTRHSWGTGLRCNPISKQGYGALGRAPVGSWDRTRLGDHGSVDGLCAGVPVAVRSCCWAAGLVTRRRSRGRRGGRVRGK